MYPFFYVTKAAAAKKKKKKALTETVIVFIMMLCNAWNSWKLIKVISLDEGCCLYYLAGKLNGAFKIGSSAVQWGCVMLWNIYSYQQKSLHELHKVQAGKYVWHPTQMVENNGCFMFCLLSLKSYFSYFCRLTMFCLHFLDHFMHISALIL